MGGGGFRACGLRGGTLGMLFIRVILIQGPKESPISFRGLNEVPFSITVQGI